ncbi:MAG: hypothetical protein AB1324_05865 [Candidatus Micrarchaeota archaeon]
MPPKKKKSEEVPAETKMPAEAPEKPAKPQAGGGLKMAAVGALFVIALALAIYFILLLPGTSFVPGTAVDAETFKGIFANASKVYIIMDVRGAPDSATSQNVIQCGIDFAASSGMGGKVVTPMSFGSEGCVAPDGPRPIKECVSLLSDGVTVYVREGPGGATYHSNGMVVTVGREYSLGTCGIKRT